MQYEKLMKLKRSSNLPQPDQNRDILTTPAQNTETKIATDETKPNTKPISGSDNERD